MKDLSGIVFGKLTAIWPAGTRKGSIVWLCFCGCGDLKLVTQTCLSSGQTSGKHCKKCNPRIDGTTPHTLWAGARQRARRDNLDFNLSVSDIIIPNICPKLGILLFSSKGRMGQNSPSIDRKDSSRGYTKDNIQVISWKANRLKNNGTKEEFELLIRNWEN